MEEDWLPPSRIKNVDGLNRYFAEERKRDLGKIIRAEIIQLGRFGAERVRKDSKPISVYIIEIKSENEESYITHIPKKTLDGLEGKAK